MSPMKDKRHYLSACSINDEFIYAFGGFFGSTEQEINEVIAQFGLEKESKIPGQGIKLNNLLTLMKDKKVDPFLVSEIKEGGLGNDLVTEDFENGFIDIKSFANWFYIE
jgi:hypothetical protein